MASHDESKGPGGSEAGGFKPAAPEREHSGSIWSHPYLIYVLLTMVLFGLLVLLAWLAHTNGWVPTR